MEEAFAIFYFGHLLPQRQDDGLERLQKEKNNKGVSDALDLLSHPCFGSSCCSLYC